MHKQIRITGAIVGIIIETNKDSDIKSQSSLFELVCLVLLDITNLWFSACTFRSIEMWVYFISPTKFEFDRCTNTRDLGLLSDRKI